MSANDSGLRLALAQINPTVGDIDVNRELAAGWIARAREAGADLVVLPELVITGYPPEDLLLKEHFVEAALAAVETLAADIEDIVALVGAPHRIPGEPGLFNGLHVLADGAVASVYAKQRLPNYGVFDEGRYFEPGRETALIDVAGTTVGLTVCEDVWFPGPPSTELAAAGARLIVNASASPYQRGKGLAREAMVAERARESAVPIALCNAVGGQDELVFDGHSFVVDEAGATLARAAQFSEELLLYDLPPTSGTRSGPGIEPALAAPLAELPEVYAALRLGLADYICKNGFGHVVLGLSGGIDSALVALLAADAVGAERVSCVVMPSPHSAAETQADARAIAANLGCELIEVEIAPVMAAYEEALAASFAGTEPDVAEENLQARIRGNIVMGLSNKFGWLPLTTGNKSEMSVGYATLYGDMSGGFAPLKDVPKLLVYELVEHRNEVAGRELIPASVIERPPSAELRPDQLDSDSLPPYEELDRALEEYVERDGSLQTLVAAGIDEGTAARVIGLVERAEYKRRQAPPGVKITPKAFGRDRRMPITNRFGG